MRKDLLALREVDALKERGKIVRIKTLEEQRQEQEKRLTEKEQARAEMEKAGIERVLEKTAGEERIAEKNIKEYATEPERQQIFLLESQRLGLEKQAEEIDKEKDPVLKLAKNRIMLEKKEWESKLNSILEQEKKFEEEQKFITEKEQSSAVSSEKKSLEQRRWELEEEIKKTEKKRWEVEKQLEGMGNKIRETDKSSEALVAERNNLRNQILGIDKSLREIYSSVIARVEEKRRGQAEEQKTTREAAAKIKVGEKEKTQRQQWTPSAGEIPVPISPVKEKLMKAGEAEEEQRKKFMQDVEEGTKNNTSNQI